MLKFRILKLAGWKEAQITFFFLKIPRTQRLKGFQVLCPWRIADWKGLGAELGPLVWGPLCEEQGDEMALYVGQRPSRYCEVKKN